VNSVMERSKAATSVHGACDVIPGFGSSSI
jgi:hypothetical protein